jgi:hypothetical protein
MSKDSRVIGDAPPVHGDVEINANEDFLSLEVSVEISEGA